MSEETAAKRLVRAKDKIRAAHVPYQVPDEAELPSRLRAVLSVLYLFCNAGADDIRRRDLRRRLGPFRRSRRRTAPHLATRRRTGRRSSGSTTA